MFSLQNSAIDVSASGLTAERMRMEVIANNIANAYSTRSPQGGAYRRQQVVFGTALNNYLQTSGSLTGLQGVRVLGVQADLTALPKVHNPGHPDADADGYVEMPNVKVTNEMVDLITATRSYEANLRAIRTFREMAQQTLSLLRG